MRRLNVALADLPLQAYKRRVKALGKHVLVHRRRDEDAIGFTVPRWLRRKATKMNKAIAESGVQVVGDLSELEPVDTRGDRPREHPSRAGAGLGGRRPVHRAPRRQAQLGPEGGAQGEGPDRGLSLGPGLSPVRRTARRDA